MTFAAQQPFNVWALDKSVELKLVLLELFARFGEERFVLLLHDGQSQAIELATKEQPEVSAYIYTIAQPSERYGVDLKFPMAENNLVGANENLTLENIFSILTTHLEIDDE